MQAVMMIAACGVTALDAAAPGSTPATDAFASLRMISVPLAMAAALACFLLRASAWPRSAFTARVTAGLVAYLAADSMLLVPRLFVPSLLAYMVAQLCLLWAFQHDVPRLPCWRSLVVAVLISAGMYMLQFPALPFTLRIVAAGYFGAMSLMVAQALGRATLLRTPASAAMAAGAVLLLATDCLITIHHYAASLPGAGFWSHATCYCTQRLSVWHAEPARAALAVRLPSKSAA
jgi:alkylglycerol monooxygenase